MRSACVVRTRFILDILVGLDWGSQDPQDPPLGYAPGTQYSRCKETNRRGTVWCMQVRSQKSNKGDAIPSAYHSILFRFSPFLSLPPPLPSLFHLLP